MKVKLSPQQARALSLYGQGQSLREISIALGVSYNRVLNIINEILAKTPFKNKQELLMHAQNIEIDD